jgi:hypothetical protein
MAGQHDDAPIELHLFSPLSSDKHVELLTAIAHYHRTSARLGLGHTVNLGRSWLPGSSCNFGLISLPYLDGPTLEIMNHPDFKKPVRLLWLIPITKEELIFKKTHGLEALEERFEKTGFNYLDPHRSSVVG